MLALETLEGGTMTTLQQINENNKHYNSKLEPLAKKKPSVNLIGQWHIAGRPLSLPRAPLAFQDLLIAKQAIIICLSHRRIIHLHMLSLLLTLWNNELERQAILANVWSCH